MKDIEPDFVLTTSDVEIEHNSTRHDGNTACIVTTDFYMGAQTVNVAG